MAAVAAVQKTTELTAGSQNVSYGNILGYLFVFYPNFEIHLSYVISLYDTIIHG